MQTNGHPAAEPQEDDADKDAGHSTELYFAMGDEGMDRFLHGGAQQSKDFIIERRNATARNSQLNCGAYAALLVDGSSAACGVRARQDVNQSSAFAIARPSSNSRQDYKAETLRASFRVGCRGVRGLMWRRQSLTGTVWA